MDARANKIYFVDRGVFVYYVYVFVSGLSLTHILMSLSLFLCSIIVQLTLTRDSGSALLSFCLKVCVSIMEPGRYVRIGRVKERVAHMDVIFIQRDRKESAENEGGQAKGM